MRFPSFSQVVDGARKTFLRFPLVILDAGVGTIAALILADREGLPVASIYFPILLATILGIPFLTALALTAEKRRFKPQASRIVQISGVLVLVLYALIVPQNLPDEPGLHLIRFFMLALAAHLFVAVGPFLSAGQLNGFWHFNKSLFLKVLISLLYSAVLYAGLAIALAALDNLFGVDVPGKRYFELWIAIIGLFNTWFFLAGVPEDLEQLELLTEFPRGLKVFAQYVLLPLLGVYVVILYAYLGKILVSWDWPQGWVSKLILGFAATGIFSMLLIYPIAEKVENTWMRGASRWFTLVLVPLVLLLFFAVWRRVSEYGWTEGRYLATILGIWITLFIAYFTVSKAKNIKLIPLSLCIIALFVGFGPWGAFSVAETSQIAQLRSLLEKNAILVNGTIVTRHDTVSYEDSKRISSIVAYLHDIHRWGGISKWFGTTKNGSPVLAQAEGPAEVAKRMGIPYVRTWRFGTGGLIIFTVDADGSADIRGFDRALRLTGLTMSGRTYSTDEFAYWVRPGLDSIKCVARRDGKGIDSLEIDLQQLVEGLIRDYGQSSADQVSPERMSLFAQGQMLKVKICLTFIRVERQDDRVKSMFYEGDLYYAVHRAE
jgi:hypothetical protein